MYIRKGITNKRRGVFMFLVIGGALFIPSCDKEIQVEHKIVLPPTPILTNNQSWAVVTDSYLKITQEQDRNSTVVGTVRKGEILEVLRSELEGEDSILWYQVRGKDLEGWIKGTSVKEFQNRTQAETASRETGKE